MMKTKLILVGFAALAFAEVAQAQNASEYNNNGPINGINGSAFGVNSLFSISTGANNTALGHSALFGNDVGSDNTASGFEAMYRNVFGNDNTAAGHSALYTNNVGNYNSAFGKVALYSNDTDFNSAFGDSALYNNTYGTPNTALGNSALYNNTTGSGNVATGPYALYKNTTGHHNTAKGYVALYSNTTGYNNVASGDSAMYANTTGDNNAAYGHAALYANTTGRLNTAVGALTLKANTSGLYNVAVGESSLLKNTTGTANTAIGMRAMRDNTTGSENCAFGRAAFINNKTGNGNIAIGNSALSFNSSGNYNVAIGYAVMGTNSTGNFNVAIGRGALSNNYVGGDKNTAVGHESLEHNTYGILNTSLGAYSDVATNNDTNTTAIGANAIVNISNKIRFGDANVTVIEGQVAYSFPSDARFKTNVKADDVKGLAFINKLRPVVYNFDAEKFNNFLNKNMPDSVRKERFKGNFEAATAVRQSGFIAQEVEKAAKEVGYDFNGVHKPVNDNDNYSLAYSQFVVPLVKAVQEQQAMIETQGTEIENLKKEIAVLHSSQDQVGNQQSATGIGQIAGSIDGFTMQQNVPNPFTHETVIKYNLPASINNAYMAVYDLSGKQVTTFALPQKGSASLTITSEKLAPGIYIYSIMADGKILDSRRMVVADK